LDDSQRLKPPPDARLARRIAQGARTVSISFEKYQSSKADKLKLADRHIKAARERIQRQRHLIRGLAKHRQLTDTAEVLLQTIPFHDKLARCYIGFSLIRTVTAGPHTAPRLEAMLHYGKTK
jgi:hypothetical protein